MFVSVLDPISDNKSAPNSPKRVHSAQRMTKSHSRAELKPSNSNKGLNQTSSGNALKHHVKEKENPGMGAMKSSSASLTSLVSSSTGLHSGEGEMDENQKKIDRQQKLVYHDNHVFNALDYNLILFTNLQKYRETFQQN